MRLIRIHILELVNAARALGEVKIVAAGSMYATLECDDDMCKRLSKACINWTFDQ